MWPWGSAVFGYLCYTLYTHVRRGEKPNGWAVLTVAVCASMPDVIDKPLDWQFHVFQNGYALGHSIFFGVLVAAVAVLAARHWNHTQLGVAVGVGFISHDIGDALEHVVEDGNPWYGLEHMLWPVYTLPPDTNSQGFSGMTLHYLRAYLHDVLTLHPTPYLVFATAVAVVVLPIWVYDGCPGLRELVTLLTYPFTRRP